MKKTQVALSLAGVMAAATFAPQASALPLFARQVGMACNACHFQHFPMLNGFGRSFKASAYTLMGAESKVEGDNMSLPGVLNAAILTTAGYVKTNQTGAGQLVAQSMATAGTAATLANALKAQGVKFAGDGNVYVPGTNGEFSLFVGGRTSENSGALAEIGLLQNGGVGAGIASTKIPMLWPVGDSGMRAGIVPFTTDGQGASYGFELLNTGANAVHTMVFDGGDANGSIGSIVSAQQYIGTGTPATGAAIVVDNIAAGPATLFINATKFHQVGPADLGMIGADLGSTYLRVAGTFDMAGWDSGVGVQSWSGSSTTSTLAKMGTKAHAVDFQMQGEVAGMPVGVYAEYASADKSDLATANVYNGSTTNAKSAFVVSTEWGLVPEKVTLGAAIRLGKSGIAMAGSSNASDRGVMVEGSYKLAQNMLVNLYYTHQSGDFWTQANSDTLGSNQVTLNLATIY